MKRILKLKKIKNSKTAKKNINKKRKAKRICKKLFLQIDSPHNTNEYLMSVNSSPFYNDEDDDNEDSFIMPSHFIKLSNDTNSELDLFINRESEGTNEKTILMDDQKEQKKKIILRLLR